MGFRMKQLFDLLDRRPTGSNQKWGMRKLKLKTVTVRTERERDRDARDNASLISMSPTSANWIVSGLTYKIVSCRFLIAPNGERKRERETSSRSAYSISPLSYSTLDSPAETSTRNQEPPSWCMSVFHFWRNTHDDPILRESYFLLLVTGTESPQ